MKSIVSALFAVVLLALVLAPSAVEAATPRWVVVRWGDTLASLAARYGTTTYALMLTNNLPSPNFIYAGQRLTLPASNLPTPNPPAANRNSVVHIVRWGENLYDIAARYGTSAEAIARANRLYNMNVIYTGQRLVIPGTQSVAPPPAPPAPAPGNNIAPPVKDPPSGGKWIDINIKNQTISAFQGSTALKTVKVSTGISIFPTPAGHFAVYRRFAAELMTGGSRASGTYYWLPNVPWVMYFFKSYAIHGTYWHHNFGRPMSHGCVNLTIVDARWFYEWAPNGTPVWSHY